MGKLWARSRRRRAGREARLFDFWNCWVRGCWAVVSLHWLLPRFVCCLGCFLRVWPAEGFSGSSWAPRKAAKSASTGACSRAKRSFWQESGCSCVLDHVLNPWFGCNDSSEVCWTGNIHRPVVTDTQTLFWEDTFE